MSVLDIESLLEPVSDDSPCGENLEFDPDFTAMESAARGKGEQQMGDSLIEAEEPDWRSVKSMAIDLLGRTKDLRVAMWLVRSTMREDGLPGVRDGVELVNQLTQQHWAAVHPQLDADDDDDPTERVNVVTTLASPAAILGPLRHCPLIQSRILGSATLNHVLGETDSSDESVDMDAVFKEAGPEKIREVIDDVDGIIESCKALEDFVTQQVGASRAPNLSELRDLLSPASERLTAEWKRRGGGAEAEEGESEEGDSEEEAASGEASEQSNGANRGGGGRSGGGGGDATPENVKIRSRRDVVTTLDKLCEYYERYEPSSPLPLLLRRAKRLASMSFLEILRDLTPAGVSQATAIGGIRDGDDEPMLSSQAAFGSPADEPDYRGDDEDTAADQGGDEDGDDSDWS